MTNQFAPIYSQLFCCSCPGGLADGTRCQNQTADGSAGGVFVTYPGDGEEWWVVGVGLLAFLLTVMGAGLAAFFCCSRKRQGSESSSEMMSITRLRHAFTKKQHKHPSEAHSTNNNAFLNPTFRASTSNGQLAPIETIVDMELSGSEDSLDESIAVRPADDAQFLQEDVDCPDTKPMITDSNCDSS